MGNRIKWSLVATLLLPAALAYSAVTIQDVRLIDYRIDRTKKFVTAKGTSDEGHGILALVTARSDDGKEWTALGDILPRPSVTNEITADAWAGADMMRTVLLNK